MLRKEDVAVIKSLHRRGVFLKDIATELGVHPKTVSRVLKSSREPQPERKRPESKLEPYKPKIDQLTSAGVWNARVILSEIQAEGYPGGYTILRQYLHLSALPTVATRRSILLLARRLYHALPNDSGKASRIGYGANNVR